MTNNQLTDERVTSVIERLEHYACSLKWTNVRGAQDLLAAADGLRELQERRLAAMDSEPVEMPLDYLQGHKDGLEWAAQLAEANHPETGDWLYDDPIELAKAIRKGPDMPPEQPVEDSEPDRNPVLAYADSYRDMAKQGVESVPIWSVITDLERNIAPLYRHAQPVPVVSADLLHTAASAIEDLLTTKDRTGACVWFDLPFRLRSAANAQPAPVVPDFKKLARELVDNLVDCGGLDEGVKEKYLEWAEKTCRAAMLAAAPHDTPALNSVQSVVTVPDKWIPVSEQKPGCWCRTCRPVFLNDMRFVVCPDCGNKRCPRANDHRNACTGSNEPGQEGIAYPDTLREVK